MLDSNLKTCNDVYNLPYYFTTTNVKSYLIGNYYNHIEEIGIDLYSIPYQGSDEFFRQIAQANTRVIIKVHMHFQRDFRRFWRLASVWFKNEEGIEKPFMVVQNAGREGDDYYYRFISDTNTFCEALTYLSQIFRQKMIVEDYNYNNIQWVITEDMIKIRHGYEGEGEEFYYTILCEPDEIVYAKEWVATIDNVHRYIDNTIDSFYGQDYYRTLMSNFDGEWYEDGHIVRSEDEGVCT